jgi:hypothetical protein
MDTACKDASIEVGGSFALSCRGRPQQARLDERGRLPAMRIVTGRRVTEVDVG